MHKVLLVDDDHSILEGTSLLLSDEYDVVTGQSVIEGIQILQNNPISVVVVDLHFEGQAHDGIDFIDHIFKFSPQTPVIVLSGDENTKRIVEAMRRPLVDFIAKDGEHDELLKLAIKKAIAKSTRNSKSRAVFQTNSGTIKSLLQKVDMVAQSSSESPFLILGESGTGKEELAKYIAQRLGKKLISANMSSIPKNTAESELFGHSKGAFTGAVNNKVGLITSAHSQVFFLDEIGDCPLEVQTKLLRVIQEKEIQPLGSVHPKKIDVRFIAATHQQLHEKVDSGEFRLDLLQRINTFTFEIPPLRKRPEDIELFSQMFLASSEDVFRLELSGLRALQNHNWPGNVRELRNVIERIQVCSQRKVVDECSVKEALNISGGLSQMSDVLSSGKSGNILRAIKEAGGNKTKAARLLGIHKATLYRWIDDLGLTDAVSVKSGRPVGSRAFPSFNKEGALL